MNKCRRKKRNKPKEGVCGRCGHAVVRLAEPRAGWSYGSPGGTWGDPIEYGHLRENYQDITKDVIIEDFMSEYKDWKRFY